MSTPGTTRDPAHPGLGAPGDGVHTPRRLTTETKSSFKTTEMIVYVALLIALFIAGGVTSGGGNGAGGGGNPDAFNAHQVWLYATILTIGYMVSRGLAKMGSRDPYDG